MRRITLNFKRSLMNIRFLKTGLGSIIQTLKESGNIESHPAGSLDELRKIRIAYFHSHEGLKERSFMGRWIESGTSDPFEFTDHDAYKAVVAVADLFWDNDETQSLNQNSNE